MIVNKASEVTAQPLFFCINDCIKNSNIYIKLEGLNIAGSIKLRTARFLLEGLKSKHKLEPGKTKIIESSSGNLGVALSILCKEQNYSFICVTDPNVTQYNENLMQVYGAKIIKVTEKDESGGYLATRIRLINKMIASDADLVWTNQYANQDNCHAHFMETAKHILNEIPRVDYLFVGAGTTGTLMGCLKYFKLHSPTTQVIAVDAIGSVTFGYPAQKRYIPGLGTSRKPEICDTGIVDTLIQVSESDTISTCHYLLNQYGLLVGGSTGTVMHAILQHQSTIRPFSNIVMISPDMGFKYINTVYNESWVNETLKPSLSVIQS